MQEEMQLCQPRSLPSDLRSVSVRSWPVRPVLPPGYASAMGCMLPLGWVLYQEGHCCPVPIPAACPKWAFGPGCSEECLCVQPHTQHCDKRDGSCSCKPGYSGVHCETSECADGHPSAPSS